MATERKETYAPPVRHIVRTFDEKGPMYLTARRPTPDINVKEAQWVRDVAEAKIFASKRAATNSNRRKGRADAELIPVEVRLIEPPQTEANHSK